MIGVEHLPAPPRHGSHSIFGAESRHKLPSLIQGGETTAMKVASACVLILVASLAAADTNDYPTEARADYGFVVMKTNGETPEMLRRCSCSIDVIASLLPYDRHVAAQTVASLNQARGQIGTMFRGSAQLKGMLADLRRAQAEAEIRCF